MEWFRKYYPTCNLDKEEVCIDCDSQSELPSTDGLVVGQLKSLKATTKHGIVSCSTGIESNSVGVVLHRELLSLSSADVGDRLAFRIRKTQEGEYKAEAPIWKELVARYVEAKKTLNEHFPEYVGVVTSILASGESGSFESPPVLEIFGRSAYVSKALLVGLEVGDTVACNIRVNGKGNPQVAEPIFKKMRCMSGKKYSLARNVDSVQKPFVIKILQGTCEANWSAIPSELLPRILATAGPAELNRLPSVCHSWSDTIDDARFELEEFWKAMSVEYYPSMTAKIIEARVDDNDMRSSSASNERELDLESTSLSWRQVFMRRHLKQLQWDAEKRCQQSAKQLRREQQQEQLAVEDKQRGQIASKARNGQEQKKSFASKDRLEGRSIRSVRVKTCRRCCEKYMPGLNEADSCHWHRGQYLPLDSETEETRTENADGAARKKIQQLLKANGRKKKSKQYSVGSDGQFAWSCCGAANITDLGCATGPHS